MSKTSIQEAPKFSIHYVKTKPIDLDVLAKDVVLHKEESTASYSPFSIKGLQIYNPIYKLFFDLNKKNYNSISMNHEYSMKTLNTVVHHSTKETKKKPLFIKFSPLLDPIRYLIGKYKSTDETIRNLPTLDSTEDTVHPKLLERNNASYVDNFFCFLSGQLYTNHGFSNAVEYFGSYLGIQEQFKLNITDDLDYLSTSSYFLENRGKLYTTTMLDEDEFANFGSRSNKQKLLIGDSANDSIIIDSIIDITTDTLEPLAEPVIADALIYEKSEKKSTSTYSSSNNSVISCSDEEDNAKEDKRSGQEDKEEEKDEDDDNEDDENKSSEWNTEDETEDEDGEDDDTEQFAFVKNFPVQLICLERCDGTLDELFMKKSINVDESASALFQIIMILIAYQKSFHFTHNDLHTNNIMYNETAEKYIYYKYNDQIYKVPTYGKIYKIIDFGRSIYKFNGQTFCSDSFAPGGDADTQYNCEPFLNEKKPKLEPNYSFDLCRLACSLYDFIIDETTEEDIKKFNSLQATVYRWCTDDNGKNVLYKKSGEERYPNFKLYKMIARTVHKHVPKSQLGYPFFNQFWCKTLLADIPTNVIDIDQLPVYV